MNFIAEHLELKGYLRADDQNIPVLFTKFFFRAAGSFDQKSPRGLFKAILHASLTHRRDLIKIVFSGARRALYGAAFEFRQEELVREE
jgi:hypothetical protein